MALNSKPFRDYKQATIYESSPEQIHNRVLRNAARREAIKSGAAHKGDGKDVDHITALSKGGTNAKGNRRVVSKSENRSFPRNPDGSMKSNT